MSDISRWESDYSVLFNSFANELQKWSKSYELPKAASQDLKYFFKLRGKRLEKLNLGYEYKLEKWFDDQVTSGNKVTSTYNNIIPLNIGKYNRFQNFRSYKETIKYYYNNTEIYNKTRNIDLYQIIYDINKGSNVGENPYTCPNCGAVTKIKDLQEEGCPYCRTKYIISDLFPKTINFYSGESLAIDENEIRFNKKKIIGLALCFSIVISLIESLGKGFSSMIPNVIMRTIILSILFFVFKYLSISFGALFKLANQAKKSIPIMAETTGAKNEITNKLKKYDENFSYEYFEGKCLSLIRNIVFNENAQNYPQYTLEKVNDRFKNIIDISYRMAMSMVEDYVKDDYLYIKMKVFLNNTYFIYNKIQNKDESMYVTIKHNIKFKTNMDFSISEVNCKYCGGSFNALTEKNCPFCHMEYKLDEEDWLVVGFE